MYADYITDGITQGFRTGFHYTCQLGEAKHNLLSAEQSPQVVDDYLSQEVQWGRVPETGPEEQGPITHASAIGVIPKIHKPRQVC